MAPPSRIIPQDQLSCQPTANSGALLQGPNNNPPAARSRDHSILPKTHSCPSDLAKMEELPKVKRSASELLPRPPEGKQKFYPSNKILLMVNFCFTTNNALNISMELQLCCFFCPIFSVEVLVELDVTSTGCAV